MMRERAILICAALMAALAGGAAGSAAILSYRLQSVPLGNMRALDAVPAKVGEWTLVPTDEPPVDPAVPDAFGKPVRVYDKVVARTYARPDGRQVQLMLAYQRQQHQEDRVHPPELCYYSQGYVLTGRRTFPLRLKNGEALARAFTATGERRKEEVVFWIRTGELMRHEPLATRAEIFVQGLKGHIVDGILVRASMPDYPGDAMDAPTKQRLIADFLAKMEEGSPEATRRLLAGAGAA